MQDAKNGASLILSNTAARGAATVNSPEMFIDRPAPPPFLLAVLSGTRRQTSSPTLDLAERAHEPRDMRMCASRAGERWAISSRRIFALRLRSLSRVRGEGRGEGGSPRVVANDLFCGD